MLSFIEDVGSIYDDAVDGRVWKVGVGVASTFLGFCAHHDSETFKSIDTIPSDFDTDNLFRYAYRALCHELYLKSEALRTAHTLKDYDRGQPPWRQQFVQELFAGHVSGSGAAFRSLQHYKRAFDQALLGVHQPVVHSLIIRFDRPPEVTVSGCLFPTHDAKCAVLRDETNLEIISDVLAFFLLQTTQGGAAVFVWIGEAPACDRLIASIMDIKDQDLPDAILRFAITNFENLYFSPSWWDSLSNQRKHAIRSRFHQSIGEITPPPLVSPGAIRLVDWRVTGREVLSQSSPRSSQSALGGDDG